MSESDWPSNTARRDEIAEIILSGKSTLFEVMASFVEKIADMENPEHYGNARDALSAVKNEAAGIMEAAALASSKLEDKAVSFLKRAADGNHRIISTGDLTIHQIAEARANGMMFVDEGSNLGWVLLPWALTTAKDEQRNAGRAEGAKL